jgi:hypothetical protein
MNTEKLKELLTAATATVPPIVPKYMPDHQSDFVRERTRRADTATRAALIAHLESEPELHQFRGHLAIKFPGTGGQRFNYDDLADWLVWQTLNSSQEQAIEGLKRHLQSQYLTFKSIRMFYGVTVDQPIRLDRFTLVPFPHLPDSLHKIEMEQLSMTEPGIKPHAAISIEYQTPIQHVPIEPTPPAQISYDGPYEDHSWELYDALLCLAVTVGHPVEGVSFWWASEEGMPFPNTFHSGWSSHSSSLKTGPNFPQKIPSGEIPRIENFIRSYFDLSEDKKARLRIPMRRVNLALGNGSMEDRVINLSIAIEALTISKQKEWEVKYFQKLFRKNKSPKENYLNRLFETFRQMRNDAIHYGKINVKYNLDGNPKDSQMLLKEAIEAIRWILGKMIVDRIPDWNSLFP